MPSLISSSCLAETDRKEEEKEGEDKSQPRSIRDRRRPREKRRSTGVSFWTQDVRPRESLRFYPAGMCWPKFCVFVDVKGEDNDPDQQSDSEEGSNKAEPQVNLKSLHLDSGSCASSLTAERGFAIFSSLFPPFLSSFPLLKRMKCSVTEKGCVVETLLAG